MEDPTFYTLENCIRPLRAQPQRSSGREVGCVDTAAISYRQTLPTTIAGLACQTTAVYIYGPFEAGFSSTQPGMSCLGTQSVVGGIDTYTAELMIRVMCNSRIEP